MPRATPSGAKRRKAAKRPKTSRVHRAKTQEIQRPKIQGSTTAKKRKVRAVEKSPKKPHTPRRLKPRATRPPHKTRAKKAARHRATPLATKQALRKEIQRLKAALAKAQAKKPSAKKPARSKRSKKPKKPKKPAYRPSRRRRVGKALRLLTRAEERSLPLESVYRWISGQTDLSPREVFTLGRSPDLADDLTSDLWMGDVGT